MFTLPSDWLLADHFIFPVSVVVTAIIETGICKNSIRPDRRFGWSLREISEIVNPRNLQLYDRQNGSYSSAVGYDTLRRSTNHFGTKFSSDKNSAVFCRVVEDSTFVQISSPTYQSACYHKLENQGKFFTTVKTLHLRLYILRTSGNH